MQSIQSTRCSTVEMVKYALGACSESLIMNSFFGFAMLYYTKALGLPASWAGIASLVSMFLILRYPVTKALLENLRQASADVP